MKHDLALSQIEKEIATFSIYRQRGRVVKAPQLSSTWSWFKTYWSYFVVSLGKTYFTGIFPAWRSWQTVLDISHISIELKK